jgi:hypothetical protein
MTTKAPSRAKRLAMALPIPEADPVTTATLSLNRIRVLLQMMVADVHPAYFRHPPWSRVVDSLRPSKALRPSILTNIFRSRAVALNQPIEAPVAARSLYIERPRSCYYGP